MNQFDTKELPEFGMWSYDADSERLCWSDELFLMLGHAPQSFTPSADDLIAVLLPKTATLRHKRRFDPFFRRQQCPKGKRKPENALPCPNCRRILY